MDKILAIYQLILMGLLILMAFGQLVSFWQKERSLRNFFFFFVFLFFTELYLVTIFHAPAPWLWVSRGLLVFSLAGANWYGAWGMIAYTREQEESAALEPVPTQTLGDLTRMESPASIDATEKKVTEDPVLFPISAVKERKS